MKSLGKLFCVVVVSTILTVNLSAGIGSDRMQFLKFSPSPRATAMADTTVSLLGDVNNMFYNPAGAFSFNSIEASLCYTRWIQSLNFFNFAGKMKFKNIGDIGVGFVSLIYDDLFKVTEENGVLVKTDEEVDLSDYYIAFNYSRSLSKKLFVGMSSKIAGEKIETSTTSLGIDVGGVYLLTEKINVGLSILNLGIKDAPVIIKSGANYKLSFRKSTEIILAGEIDSIADSGLEVGIGAEATILKMFFVRTGYRIGGDSGAFRIGAGMKYKMFQIDYSFNSYGDLGKVSRVGIKAMINII